ncbi:MAG TPA: hypothetical protein VNT30_06230 [Stellaceae bacterium]|nr:hypothetical protein [Stellaceae bacterium]
MTTVTNSDATAMTAPPADPPADPQADPGADPALSSSTHFVFTHAVFRAPGAGFMLSTDGTPSFMTRLADLDVLIPIVALATEFAIEADSDDGKLLAKVTKSLQFVKLIRPNDSIPLEILDGTASWSVEPHHLELAQNRLAVQLSSWIMGSETVVVDGVQLMQLADDPATKTRIQQAASEMAVRLGLKREEKSTVFDRIESVARELAYIEALRDRFSMVMKLAALADGLKKAYRRERGICDDIARVQSLIRHPLREFQSIFDQIDAQSGELLSLLRNLSAQINFIREARDQLHIRMMLWDEILVAWADVIVERSTENEDRIRLLYRFLARHFTVHKQWELSNQIQRREA